MAQLQGPVHVVDAFDAATNLASINSQGRDVIAVYGEDINLGGAEVSAVVRPAQRTQDVVFVARTLRVGPETRVRLNGQRALETFDSLRAGDLYLVADTLVVDGLSKGNLLPPLSVDHIGGYNPSSADRLRSRNGRVFVFVNRIEVAPQYSQERSQVLRGGSQGDVPAGVLKIITRDLSPTNSAHGLVAKGQSLPWAGLGEAYHAWLQEEPLAALVFRELKLTRERASPYGGDGIPDVVATMADAIKVVGADVLAPWYLAYFKRNAALAQAAFARADYDGALAAVRNSRPFTATVPNRALVAPEFKTALADLQRTEEMLAQQSVVEELSFPVDGGPPVRVTVIRDRVAGRVSVVPNQVLLNAVLDNGVYRAGFVRLLDGDIEVTMSGQLTVDSSVLELVRARFSGSGTQVRVADELQYDTLNLGLGDAVKNGQVNVSGAGFVEFNLVLRGAQYRQSLLRLAQPFGVDASIHWQHPRLQMSGQTARVNVSLGRTGTGIVGKEGVLTNASLQPVDIDYVLDGSKVLTKGLPMRLAAGASFTPGCTSTLCFAPGSAIRRVLSPAELDTWMVIQPEGSSVLQYTFESQLASEPGIKGDFVEVILDVTYYAAAGAAPQRTGPFALGARGSTTARRIWPFIGSPTGTGKLEISGRAYWERGTHDLAPRTVETRLSTIDPTWLK
jgi:hypothetical protein